MAAPIQYDKHPKNQETLTPPASRRPSLQISRKTSWGLPILPPSAKSSLDAIGSAAAENFEDVDLDAACSISVLSEGAEPWSELDNIAELGLSFHVDDTDEIAQVKARFSLESLEAFTGQSHSPSSEKPFNKWIKTLQRKSVQRREAISEHEHGMGPDKVSCATDGHSRSHHKKSSSASSLGFVTAIKSASISLASFSVGPRSRRTTAYSSHGMRMTERGSNPSNAGGRRSEDSSYAAKVDEGVMDRSLQRRRVIEEIISTEESYIADVRFLMSVSLGEKLLGYFALADVCN